MSISQSIGPHLPLLRRYARALTGNQERGDRYVAASLEAILQAPNEFPRNTTPRVGLYQIFQKIWSASQAPFEAPAHDHNGAGEGREEIDRKGDVSGKSVAVRVDRGGGLRIKNKNRRHNKDT